MRGPWRAAACIEIVNRDVRRRKMRYVGVSWLLFIGREELVSVYILFWRAFFMRRVYLVKHTLCSTLSVF
jgi:hypothetical protein